jgi:hypothetical protein
MSTLIKYLNQAINVDGIHFYGCSFTAGEELADAEYQPKINECKDWDQRQHIINKHWKLEKQLAWPQHMGVGLGISEIYNNADRGNSVSKMSAQFFNDVVTGKIRPKDMCIVGTTGYFREMTFHALEDWVDLDNPKVDDSMRGKSFCRVMTSTTESPTYRGWIQSVRSSKEYVSNQQFALQYFMHRHPWVLFHEYMNHLRDMVYIARNHDIPIIFVECLERINVKYFEDVNLRRHEDFQKPMMEYEFKDNLIFIEKEINKHKITDKNMDDLRVGSMPRGHPDQQSHVKWGQYLASLLRV